LKNPDKAELPFLAGVKSNGEPVFESLNVEFLADTPQHFRLMKSPLLTRNLAAGDVVRQVNPEKAEYELINRSGNICIRVFGQEELINVEQALTPKFEKIGGCLDIQTPRGLVYTIHISIGFETIESLLNKTCKDYPEVVWYYGNIYDPEDGITPLEWWLEFDSQD